MPKKQKPGPTKTNAPIAAATELPVAERTLNRVAVAIFFLLPLVFYWKYLFGGQMLFGTDFLGSGSYMLREFMARYIHDHRTIAYWLPGMLCGQPTGAAFYADMFYPTIFFRLFLPVHVVWTWTFTTHLSLAGLGTWLLLREYKLSPIAATLGGVAYMMAGSLVTLVYAGHDGRLIGTALLPLAVFFLHRGTTQRRFVYFILMGLILALQLLSGHIQKVYYTGMVLVAYFIWQFVLTLKGHHRAERDMTELSDNSDRVPGPNRGMHRAPSRRSDALKLCAYFLIGLGFAGALSAIQYLPIYGNMPYSARGADRGYDFATSWSMPIAETFDLVTPKFSGGLASYWSQNPFKLHSEYLGILPLLFAFIAIFRRWRDRHVKFFTFSFAGALVMAWGGHTPLYYIPYYLFPGISKFRGPAMIFFVAAFSLVVLAGLGIDYLLREHKADDAKKTTRAILVAGGIPLVLLIIFAAFKDAMIGLLKSGIAQSQQKVAALAANYPNMLSGMLFAAVIAAAGALLAWLLLTRRMKLLAFASIIALLMVVDIGLSLNLWNETTGYIRGTPPPAQYFAPDEPTAFLMTDTSLYRVLPLNYERSDEGILLYHGIQSTGGQIPNPLQSYQDFIGAGQNVMFQPGNLMQPNFMNVSNVKYVIGPTLPDDVSRYGAQDQQAIAQLKAYFSQPWFALVMHGQRYSVYRNSAVLPRAFLAPGFALAKTKDEAINLLASPGFDPARTVILDHDPGFTPTADSFAGTATITSYDANHVAVKTSARSECLLVLSENWHPDYRATIDGKPADVMRAYHTFRAVRIPAGEHEVIFRYSSPYYRLGGLLSLAALVFLAGTLVMGVVRWRRPEQGSAKPSVGS